MKQHGYFSLFKQNQEVMAMVKTSPETKAWSWYSRRDIQVLMEKWQGFIFYRYSIDEKIISQYNCLIKQFLGLKSSIA
ncbi:MAG: hypothetical protein ACTS73_09870 [Arsenophonus sp. NEOnobi-MAG3]